MRACSLGDIEAGGVGKCTYAKYRDLDGQTLRNFRKKPQFNFLRVKISPRFYG